MKDYVIGAGLSSLKENPTMSVRLSILLIFMPIIVFTVAVLVVAADEWWQNRNKLTDWRKHEP